MKKIITLLAIVFCANANAQYVTIPDANFVTYLQGLIPSAMNGNQMDTTSTLVTTTTRYMDINNRTISNLSGLQYFSSLTYLNAGGNPLVNLPVLPSSLDTLIFGACSLTNLPALPNSLNYLDCNGNYLTSLPIHLPDSLLRLDCFGNSLANLSALPSKLQTLWCTGCSFTSLPSLPNSLIELRCPNNSITSLPPLPSTLQILYCSYNSLTSLPVLPNSLIDLHCNNNSLTALPTLPNSLQYFYCDQNSINCFPIFPNSIGNGNFAALPNPCDCFPNQINAMQGTSQILPLCAPGNTYGCPPSIGCLTGLSFTLSQDTVPLTWNLNITYPPNVFSVTWDWGDTTSSNIFFPTHTYANAGWYNICVTAFDSTNCGTIYCQNDSIYRPSSNNSIISVNVINNPTGIKLNTNNTNQLNIFPNPTSDQFIIDANNADKLTVDLYDVNGRHVFSKSISDKTKIDVTTLNEGIYSLVIKTADHVINKKLVILR